MKIRLNPVLLVGIALLFVSCKDKDIKKEQGIEVNTARVSSVLAMMVSLLIFSLNSVMRSGLTNMMEAVRFRRLN